MLIINSNCVSDDATPPVEAYRFDEFPETTPKAVDPADLAPAVPVAYADEVIPVTRYMEDDVEEQSQEQPQTVQPAKAMRYDSNKVEIGLIPPEALQMTALAGSWIPTTAGPHPDLALGVRYSALYNLVQQDLTSWNRMVPPDQANVEAFLDFNGSVPPFNSLPGDAIEQLAWVFTKGAHQKYAPWNWAKGISYDRVYNAGQRHLLKWAMGHDINTDDFGLHHLGHVWWNIMVLLHYELHRDLYGAHDNRAGMELGEAMGRPLPNWTNIYSVVQLAQAGYRTAWLLHYCLNQDKYPDAADDRVKVRVAAPVSAAAACMVAEDGPEPVMPKLIEHKPPTVLFTPTINFTGLPQKATTKAAAYDLRSSIHTVLEPGETKLIPLGFAMALPEGYEAQIRPRSGLAGKHHITVPNSPGTIDEDFRDEVMILLRNDGDKPFTVNFEDRIAQMVIKRVPPVEFELVNDLPPANSTRTGGFGHTGVR